MVACFVSLLCLTLSLMEEPIILEGPNTRAFDLVYSTDGKRLAVAYESGGFAVWDVERAERMVSRDSAHTYHCRSIVWGPNDSTLWTAGDEGVMREWSSKDGETTGTEFAVERPYRVILASNPDRLLVACRDGSIRILTIAAERNSPKGTEPRALVGHRSAVRNLALTPGGNRLASVGHDEFVRIWDLVGHQCSHSVAIPGGGRLFGVACSPTGSWVAVAGDGGSIQLFDVDTGQLGKRWSAHPREIRSLSFSQDGKWLASCGEDEAVRVWNVEQQTLHVALKGHGGKGYGVVFSPTQNQLAVGRSDGRIELWNIDGSR